MKIALVGSSGGHLTQLYLLKDWWEEHDRIWVTFKKRDAESLLIKEKKYWCYFPTNRNVINLIKNSFLACKIMIREKPDLVISTGAASAFPFFILAKIMRKKTVYIEVYDRISSPTLTGRLVYPFADKFIVQWEEQLNFYPKAELVGELI